jgi:hypothetical protein
MKIKYTKNKYGYYYEIDVKFCCEPIKNIYDFSHRNSWCIALGHKSGKVRMYGAYDYQNDSYQYLDLEYCPNCGAKIELEEIPIYELVN